MSRRRPRGLIAGKVFTGALYGAGVLFMVIMIALVLELIWGARLSIATFGLGFLWGTQWNPVTSQFGALPFIYGTMLCSVL